ncbi:hypothetical protein MNBD_PLANCTO03-1842, partial [hydrothermal vent metagenome]
GLLFAAVCLYTWDAYAASRRGKEITTIEVPHEEEIEKELAKGHNPGWWMKHAVLVLVGIVCLTGGAELLVRSTVSIAERLGVSEVVIGLTMVAFGTSLPELATAVRAAMKRHTDLLLGNVIGSNVFNTLCVLGVTSMVKPIPVLGETVRGDATVMMGIGLLAWAIVCLRKHIGRVEGLVLLAGYGGYVGWVVMRATGGGS